MMGPAEPDSLQLLEEVPPAHDDVRSVEQGTAVLFGGLVRAGSQACPRALGRTGVPTDHRSYVPYDQGQSQEVKRCPAENQSQE